MIDPTRLLGALLSGSARRSLPSGAGLAVGMGAIGLAVAAFEHFAQARQVLPPAGSSAQPPPLPAPAGAPTSTQGPPPLPVAGRLSATQQPASQALVLIRAMVSAAWADGTLDEGERTAIIQRLATAGLSDEEQALAANELQSPARLEVLVAQAEDRTLAEQIYAVSLLAIRVDTPAERSYMERLAAGLGLEPEAVGRIHGLLGAQM